MDVVAVKDQSDRQSAKRQKVADASDEGRRSESRMAKTQVTQLKTAKQRARLKKKSKPKVIVSEYSEGSVAMSEATRSTTDEDIREELNLRTEGEGPSRVQNEEPM